jgi:hypothetical protein
MSLSWVSQFKDILTSIVMLSVVSVFMLNVCILLSVLELSFILRVLMLSVIFSVLMLSVNTGNTKGGSITVHLTSCLTGLD